MKFYNDCYKNVIDNVLKFDMLAYKPNV